MVCNQQEKERLLVEFRFFGRFRQLRRENPNLPNLIRFRDTSNGTRHSIFDKGDDVCQNVLIFSEIRARDENASATL